MYLSKLHAMETYGASGGIPPRKEPRYPLDRRLGGFQSRSGRGDEEKNSQPLPGFESPDHPFVQPVAQRYTTELSRPFTFFWAKLTLNICNLLFLGRLFSEVVKIGRGSF
jgi:hypothetical protein